MSLILIQRHCKYNIKTLKTFKEIKVVIYLIRNFQEHTKLILHHYRTKVPFNYRLKIIRNVSLVIIFRKNSEVNLMWLRGMNE